MHACEHTMLWCRYTCLHNILVCPCVLWYVCVCIDMYTHMHTESSLEMYTHIQKLYQGVIICKHNALGCVYTHAHTMFLVRYTYTILRVECTHAYTMFTFLLACLELPIREASFSTHKEHVF